MTTILACFLILAVIIIIIICFEFRKFKQKVEEDERADNQRYRDEVNTWNTRFENNKDKIASFVRAIAPNSGLIDVHGFTAYSKDYHIDNFKYSISYLMQLADICELATYRLNSLTAENDILKAEVKASRLLDGLGEIKSRVEISKELEKIVSILRSKDKQMDVALPRIYDLADKIDRETTDLNKAVEALEEITRSLGDIEHIMKDENIGHVDKKWQAFLSSARSILEDSLIESNKHFQNSNHIEVNQEFMHVKPMLEQISLLYADLHNKLGVSKLSSASAAGGGLIL